MNGTKYTLMIKIESLSIDTFRSQLIEIVNAINDEKVEMTSRSDDGDQVEFHITQKEVSF